jgi:pimeloyl-ACP methyl ester carboxylesterase
MLFLAQNGFRAIAHDCRGHGRSSQASAGNDMDGYADDLAAVIEALYLTDITMVGHSTGGGEVTRYIGRHGTKRVSKVVLIAAVPPALVKSPADPDGLPIELFDGLRSGLANDRAQFYKEFAVPFYGANRPGAKVSQASSTSSGSGGCRAASRTRQCVCGIRWSPGSCSLLSSVGSGAHCAATGWRPGPLTASQGSDWRRVIST